MLPVTAIMVTRGLRPALAKMAIQSFLDQSYPDKLLLIVNTGRSIYGRDSAPESVKELLIPDLDSAPLGYVRNWSVQWATELSPVRWIMQWDDDDWSHPDRMSYQATAVEASSDKLRAVVLRSQVRIDLPQQQAMVINWPAVEPAGIPGTVLLPPRQLKNYYYDPTLRKHEDTYLLARFFAGKDTLVLQNLDVPHYYLRLFHGGNTWHHKHFFQGHPTVSFDSLQPKATSDYVKHWYASCGHALTNQE